VPDPQQVAVVLESVELPAGRQFRAEPYVVGIAVGEKAGRPEIMVAPAARQWTRTASFAAGTLFPAGDPGRFVVVALAVMESDRGTRRAAALAGPTGLATGFGSPGAAMSRATDTINRATDRLQAAGDALVAHGIIGLERPRGGWVAAEYELDLGRAAVKLRVELVAEAEQTAKEEAPKPPIVVPETDVAPPGERRRPVHGIAAAEATEAPTPDQEPPAKRRRRTKAAE
jgi:hypothetical protein